MSAWSRYSPERLTQKETELVELSGTEVKTQKVDVGFGRFLYCLECGSQNSEVLLLIHGYCGAGMIFFKILKQLSQEFRVVCVDLLGMGRSSRPEFTAVAVQDSEDFFLEALELFIQTKELEQFNLAGHSFGGYIAACLALRNPQKIQRLLLLSPVGIPKKPVEYDYIRTLNSKDWKFRWVMKFLVFFWTKNITPLALLRKSGPFSKKLMKLYSKRKLLGLSPEEMQVVEDYLEQINLMPGSGDLALQYIFEAGGWAKNPLCNRLGTFKGPTHLFFGDKDWVTPPRVEETVAQIGPQVSLHFISDSDHHLYWDNPQELALKLMQALDVNSSKY